MEYWRLGGTVCICLCECTGQAQRMRTRSSLTQQAQCARGLSVGHARTATTALLTSLLPLALLYVRACFSLRVCACVIPASIICRLTACRVGAPTIRSAGPRSAMEVTCPTCSTRPHRYGQGTNTRARSSRNHPHRGIGTLSLTPALALPLCCPGRSQFHRCGDGVGRSNVPLLV